MPLAGAVYTKKKQLYKEEVVIRRKDRRRRYMNPTVSIIVPVYNAEKTLKRCVDSILGQEMERSGF